MNIKNIIMCCLLVGALHMPAHAQVKDVKISPVVFDDKTIIIPPLTTEQTAVLSRVEEYLNSINVAKAQFTQINRSQSAASGHKTNASGIFYLSRPDKMRFQYEKPNKDYIMADGNIVYYWDSALKQQSNAPQGMTLADFFLRPRISFGGDIQLLNVEEKDGVISITISQKNQENQGKMIMFFSDAPLQLHGWQVVDPTGAITDVVLEKPEFNIALDPELFVYRDANFGKNRR